MQKATWPADSVVVVEDDHDLRSALLDLLRCHGYDAVGFENGARALESLATCTTPPGVIVLDLMMPVMNGWQFRVEQKKSALLSATPVVVLTADSSPQANAIDADVVLHKPVDTAALLRLIGSTLSGVRRDRVARIERMVSLGTLVAGIAHEINNPLTYVISNLEYLDQLVKRGAGDDRLSDLDSPVTEALEGAHRIRSVIEQVRQFGRGERSRKAVLVESASEAAIKLVENQIRQRARLVREYRPAPPVLADESQLVQILVNLLVNSVQAIPEGRVQDHTIRIAVRPEGTEQVHIEVSDTGTGIADDVKRRIFEPFFTTKPAGQGTGLGLSISYAIVRAWGGDIVVESTVGVGTTARVVLPTATGAQVLAMPLALEGRPRPAARKARILVIDDEPAILRSLVRLLTEHDILTTTSAHEALTILQRDRAFDIVLSDLMMPGMTGADLHEAVRTKLPGLERKFVFMTGGVMTPSVERFVSETSCAFISKPVDTEALRALVAERLETSLYS